MAQFPDLTEPGIEQSKSAPWQEWQQSGLGDRWCPKRVVLAVTKTMKICLWSLYFKIKNNLWKSLSLPP